MTAYTKRLAEHCAEIRFQGLSSETMQHLEKQEDVKKLTALLRIKKGR
jgi:predicted MarR family transcription regulator